MCFVDGVQGFAADVACCAGSVLHLLLMLDTSRLGWILHEDFGHFVNGQSQLI